MAGQRGRDDQAIRGIGMEIGELRGPDADLAVNGDLHHALFQMFPASRRHERTSSVSLMRPRFASMATSRNEIAETATAFDRRARSISRRALLPSLRSPALDRTERGGAAADGVRAPSKAWAVPCSDASVSASLST